MKFIQFVNTIVSKYHMTINDKSMIYQIFEIFFSLTIGFLIEGNNGFQYQYLLSSMLRRVAPVADMYARLSTLALSFYQVQDGHAFWHHYSCFPKKQ